MKNATFKIKKSSSISLLDITMDKNKCPFLIFSNNFFRNFRSFSELEHLVGSFKKVLENYCYHNLKKGTMG